MLKKILPLALMMIGIGFCRSAAFADDAGSYGVVKTIKLGGPGRWDYATLDDKGELLYLPRSTHTMVVNVASGAVVADIAGGKGLHGVALATESGHGFITDGEAGSVIVFDIKTNAVLGKIAAADDADGVIYDATTGHVFVACGDAGSLVPIPANVDPKSGKADAAIDLGGKPEFLVADGNGNIFVNIEDKAEVVEVDGKTMKVTNRFPIAPGANATGLAMDREHGVLFVGCRNQKMIVMSAKDGKVLANLPIGKGVDATAFAKGIAFASCGDGTLTLVKETSPGKYEVVQTAKTVAGARTMAIDSKTGTAYLPAAEMLPANGGGRPAPVADSFKVVVVAPGEAPAK